MAASAARPADSTVTAMAATRMAVDSMIRKSGNWFSDKIMRR
jgi:hypothetical protein